LGKNWGKLCQKENGAFKKKKNKIRQKNFKKKEKKREMENLPGVSEILQRI